MNLILRRVIPFNGPHKFKVSEIKPGKTVVEIPFRTSNKNHLRGLHACAMVTAAEYGSGLSLLYLFGLKDYRLIMKSLDAEYFKQGKSASRAVYAYDEKALRKKIAEGIEQDGKVFIQETVSIVDAKDEELCKVNVNWQLKPWSQVSFK